MLYIYPIKNILRRKAEFSETEFTESTVLLQGVESFLPLAQGYNDPFGKIQADKEMALQKEGKERKVIKQSVVTGFGLRLNCRGEVKQRVQGWSQESLAATAASHHFQFDLNRMVGPVTLSKKRKESRGDG